MAISKKTIIFLSIGILLICLGCSESLAVSTSKGVLDAVTEEFKNQASLWEGVITTHAKYLFFSLMLISIVWNFGQLLLKQSGLAEFVFELIRFTVVSGIFYWVINNASDISLGILEGLGILGLQASTSSAMSPTDILTLGFNLASGVREVASFSISGLCSVICAYIAAILIALIAVNMTLQICTAYLLAYAGIFFLGFAGHQITRDIAINYIKTVIACGASLMTMYLMVGICENIVTNYHEGMNASQGSSVALADECMVMMVATIIMYALMNKLPPMIAGFITGSSANSASGVGTFTAGTAIGAGIMAYSGTKSVTSFAGRTISGTVAGVAQGKVSERYNKASAMWSGFKAGMNGGLVDEKGKATHGFKGGIQGAVAGKKAYENGQLQALKENSTTMGKSLSMLMEEEMNSNTTEILKKFSKGK